MSTVTIEPRCERPLITCTHCGNYGPFTNRDDARAFKARHSLMHQQERDAQAARRRRAGAPHVAPECFTADVSRDDPYAFEVLP